MEQSFKLIIIMFISMVCIGIVSGVEICLEPILPNVSCNMVTPTLYCSGDYYFFVYDNSSNILEYGNLTTFTTNTYFFPFTYDVGTYYLEICDGSTRQIIVEGDTMIGFTDTTWIFVLLILLFIAFIFLAFRIHPIFLFLDGIIFSYFAYYSYTLTQNWFLVVMMGMVGIALMFVSIIGSIYNNKI